jgi:hypothetical protein
MHEVSLASDYHRYLETETAKLPPEFDIFPRRRDYATAPLEQGIDLEAVLTRLSRERDISYGQKYGVVFRSDQRPGLPEDFLDGYDKPAHKEARLAPGYIYYFKGPILVANRNMSFCLWETPGDGHLASDGIAHRAAVEIAEYAYKSVILERLSVNYQPGGVTVEELFPPVGMEFDE